MRRTGAPLPEFRQPYPILFRLWRGFWRLQGDRKNEVGAMGGVLYGALPYAAVADWLRCNGYVPDTERWERAENLLFALDREYLKAKSAELAAGSQPPPDKKRPDAAAGEW